MPRKQVAKIVTDILMTVILLLLMARSLVGETAHEWLGIGMFALFLVHHILNRKWTRNLGKGTYTPFRVVQILLVMLALAAMVSSMVSGIVISRHAFAFLGITEGQAWARTLHMLAAYWGFVILSLHLGLHWNTMVGMAGKLFKTPSPSRAWTARILGLGVAGYGVAAFFKREIGSYMLLRNQFVFFDLNEPLVFFLLDYIAVMGLFVFIGHYLAKALKGQKKGRSSWKNAPSEETD